MDKNGSPGYFVATTALEEFWDISYPMVFLGEWCKRYSRRSYWGTIESTTLPSPIQEQGLFEVISYLQKVYERLLPVLAKTLNDVHEVSFSTRYWRIVLGPWLLYYLHTLHNKYVQIISLKQKYPDFTTTCLDESCFVIPDDTLIFDLSMIEDSYNLQLYSQLFVLLGFKFPTKKRTVEIGAGRNISFYIRPKTIKNRLQWLLIGFLDRALSKRTKVIFESVYFDKSALIKLMLKMKGRFLPFVPSGQMMLNLPANQEIRKKMGGIQFGDNEFERMLLPMIGRGLPKSMLEGYSSQRAGLKRKNICPPKAIMSGVGWYVNEEFKMFAAESAEKGTKLLGVQHGGGYGMLEYLFQEEYELSVTDKYFSWGWTRKDCNAKVEPLSATKLVNKKNRYNDKGSGDILYVTNFVFRYLMTYPAGVDSWKDYLKQQSLFLSHLSKGVQERLVIRPHREDGGLDFKERFRDIIPGVRIETWARPFSGRNYGLLVCDHPCDSTTFIESLANNKPTLIFTNPNFAANYINQSTKTYWDRLKETGVLHDDPIKASSKIDEIYDNVDEWWHQPQRQEGIRSFLSVFGRVSGHWDKEWVSVLKEQLD